jgi:hypothetical protein
LPACICWELPEYSTTGDSCATTGLDVRLNFGVFSHEIHRNPRRDTFACGGCASMRLSDNISDRVASHVMPLSRIGIAAQWNSS